MTLPLSSICITAGTPSQSPVPFGSLDSPLTVYAFLIAASIAFLSSPVNFLGSLTSVFSGIAGFTVVLEQDINLWGSFTKTPTIWSRSKVFPFSKAKEKVPSFCTDTSIGSDESLSILHPLSVQKSPDFSLLILRTNCTFMPSKGPSPASFPLITSSTIVILSISGVLEVSVTFFIFKSGASTLPDVEPSV